MSYSEQLSSMALLDSQGDICVLQGDFEKTQQEAEQVLQQKKAEKYFEELNMDEFELPDEEEQTQPKQSETADEKESQVQQQDQDTGNHQSDDVNMEDQA